jgi:Trypsin-like peptidase domain
MSELSEILAKHKTRLLSMPGCTGVAIGYKEVKGEVIDRLAIIVFVKRKQPDIAAEHLVPAVLDDAPTDVVEKTFGLALTATDPFTRFPQLMGGISITPRDVPPPWGSLGCIIHTTGNAHVPHAGNYLLSNQHVLSYADPANPHSTTRQVIQPGKTDEPAPGNYSCGDYVWGQTTPTSDCAIASIGYGRTWRNQVPNHPLRPGNRDLKGIAVAAVGDEVYKYGATTKSTRGVVRYVHYDDRVLPIRDSIYVANADGTMWVAKGDSGSVLIRYSDDFVVGLNFAADETTILGKHPALPNDLPAYSAGYAYDIQSQMNLFGGVVTLA